MVIKRPYIFYSFPLHILQKRPLFGALAWPSLSKTFFRLKRPYFQYRETHTWRLSLLKLRRLALKAKTGSGGLSLLLHHQLLKDSTITYEVALPEKKSRSSVPCDLEPHPGLAFKFQKAGDMLGQLSISHPYEVLVKFYCNKFWLANLNRPKAKILCRKRHDLAFNKGCGRLHCGLCAESKNHGSRRNRGEGQELFSRRLVYCSSFSSDGLQADLQEVRGEDFFCHFICLLFVHIS